jgi:histone-lysine N-methyltransferase SETMAR
VNRTGQLLLLHDNAPAHCAIRVRQLLAQRAVSVVDHPPHSPYLTPAYCFLFPRLKSVMKGARFPDVAAIQGRVTAVLRLNAKRAFADSFQQLHERCQKCVVMNGDYCEGE